MPTPAPTAAETAAPSHDATPLPPPTPSAMPPTTVPSVTSGGATATPGASAAPASPAGLAWRERGDVVGAPAPRSDQTWTVEGSGSAAYLFGGRVRGGSSSAELWRLDLTTDEWAFLEPSGPAPAARWGHTGTWVPGVGLVIWSGQHESGFFGDIWAYDPEANAWRELPSLGAVPQARYGSCASLGPDGRLWISHGFTQDEARFADTRAYDFATGEWTDLTPTGRVPIERCLHDCWWSADGSKLVLYAGQTTDVPALADAWAYDFATGDWTAGVDGPAPPRNLYGLAPVGGGALVFGGGSNDRGYLDDAWILDEASLELAPMDVSGGPPPRAGTTLISDPARGRVLLFGGEGPDGLLGDLWELTGV